MTPRPAPDLAKRIIGGMRCRPRAGRARANTVRPERRLIGAAILLGGLFVATTPAAAAASLPTVQGPLEDAAVAGVASPNWAPDTRLAVVGAGAATEWHVTAAVRTYRYVGVSLATAKRSPTGPVLGPSGAGFDRDYAGLSGVIARPGGGPGSRIGFYHAERHCRTVGPEGRTLERWRVGASRSQPV